MAEPDGVEGVDLGTVVGRVFRAAELLMAAHPVIRTMVYGVDAVNADLAPLLARDAAGRRGAAPLARRLQGRLALPDAAELLPMADRHLAVALARQGVADRKEAKILAVELVRRSHLGMDALAGFVLAGDQAGTEKAVLVVLGELVFLIVGEPPALRIQEPLDEVLETGTRHDVQHDVARIGQLVVDPVADHRAAVFRAERPKSVRFDALGTVQRRPERLDRLLLAEPAAVGEGLALVHPGRPGLHHHRGKIVHRRDRRERDALVADPVLAGSLRAGAAVRVRTGRTERSGRGLAANGRPRKAERHGAGIAVGVGARLPAGGGIGGFAPSFDALRLLAIVRIVILGDLATPARGNSGAILRDYRGHRRIVGEPGRGEEGQQGPRQKHPPEGAQEHGASSLFSDPQRFALLPRFLFRSYRRAGRRGKTCVTTGSGLPPIAA